MGKSGSSGGGKSGKGFAGWPSTNGNPSGGGRANAPPEAVQLARAPAAAVALVVADLVVAESRRSERLGCGVTTSRSRSTCAEARTSSPTEGCPCS